LGTQGVWEERKESIMGRKKLAERQFIEIPTGISNMTDAEIDDWAANIYQKFVSERPDTFVEDEGGNQV